jgi:hypothetical protein
VITQQFLNSYKSVGREVLRLIMTVSVSLAAKLDCEAFCLEKIRNKLGNEFSTSDIG